MNLACGETVCPVVARLAPQITSGKPLPDQATDQIRMGDLVPQYCVKCYKWDDKAVQLEASRVHLVALRQRHEPFATALAHHLEGVSQSRDEVSNPADALPIAISRLHDAYDLLLNSGPHESALRPLFDERLKSVLKRFVRHPADLFAMAGWATAPKHDVPGWDHYLSLVRGRVQAEGGAFETQGDEATVSVRDTVFRLRNSKYPKVDSHEVPVTVIGSRLGHVLPLLGAVLPPIVVQVGERVSAPNSVPAWARRLLDPRSDLQLAEEFRRSLEEGPTPIMFTEAFITAREHEREWPRVIVKAVFDAMARDGQATHRKVPGVGDVIVFT